MNWMVASALMLIGAGMGARAASPPAAQDLLQFQQKLSGAICDESVASKPPALETTRRAPAPEMGARPAAPLPEFELRLRMPEPQLVAFLLGDSGTPLSSPQLEDRVAKKLRGRSGGAEESESLARSRVLGEERRRISLEVCHAMASPSRMRKLLDGKPSWFLQLRQLGSSEEEPPKPGTGFGILHLRDTEWRFGRVGDRWWAAGWVEPYEVKSLWYGRREYRRLSNPVTNQTRMIVVMGRDEIPLGMLYPSSENASADWELLRTQARTELSRQRKLELYRAMMEEDAYRAAGRDPARTGTIRQYQDFYRNLMAAYHAAPEDPQFTQYARKARRPMTSAEVHKVLDRDFFEALSAAKVNGARVSFGYFEPDPVLQGMMVEYRERTR